MCVIDPECWLTTWHSRFKNLDIKWLRSPFGAHPDTFDAKSMLAFAISQGRDNEILDSGLANNKALARSRADELGSGLSRKHLERSGGSWSAVIS